MHIKYLRFSRENTSFSMSAFHFVTQVSFCFCYLWNVKKNVCVDLCVTEWKTIFDKNYTHTHTYTHACAHFTYTLFYIFKIFDIFLYLKYLIYFKYLIFFNYMCLYSLLLLFFIRSNYKLTYEENEK